MMAQDLDKDEDIPEPYRLVSAAEAHDLQKQETENRKQGDRTRAKKLQRLGFEIEHTGEVLL